MECDQTTWLSGQEYWQWFGAETRRLRIPTSGGIALTHCCNLSCVHCYLGPQAVQHQRRHLEMTTEQVISVIDQITQAGCLFLLITGGEPLVRKDFSQIYRHAVTNGLIVTVFTNATLITDDILDLFVNLPPRNVEITLYGATSETYEKVTGVRGSYNRCLAGIRRLLDRKIHLSLKTMLMTLNSHEYLDMQAVAKNYGVKFRSDPVIIPTLEGDQAPLRLRLPPEKAIEKELDDEKIERWRDFLKRYEGSVRSDALYQCGAGLTHFYIDPYGHLQPCLMTTGYQYDLMRGDFLTGWREVILDIRQLKSTPGHVCNQCEMRHLCGLCPALSKLEGGTEESPLSYLCAIGHHRLQAIEMKERLK